MTEEISIKASSGNVFADLGLVNLVPCNIGAILRIYKIFKT